MSSSSDPIPDSRPPADDDAWLESVLRTTGPAPVADDGFTRAVLERLPPRWARAERRRRWLLAGAAAAGAGLALALSGSGLDRDQQLALLALALEVEFWPIVSLGGLGVLLLPWVLGRLGWLDRSALRLVRRSLAVSWDEARRALPG